MLIGAYEQFLRIVYFLQLHIFFRKQEKDYWYRKKIAPWKLFTLKPSEIQLDRKKKWTERIWLKRCVARWSLGFLYTYRNPFSEQQMDRWCGRDELAICTVASKDNSVLYILLVTKRSKSRRAAGHYIDHKPSEGRWNDKINA